MVTRTVGDPHSASAAEATIGNHTSTHSQWLTLIISLHNRPDPPVKERSRYLVVEEWARMSLVVVRACLWTLFVVGEPDAPPVEDNMRC